MPRVVQRQILRRRRHRPRTPHRNHRRLGNNPRMRLLEPSLLPRGFYHPPTDGRLPAPGGNTQSGNRTNRNRPPGPQRCRRRLQPPLHTMGGSRRRHAGAGRKIQPRRNSNQSRHGRNDNRRIRPHHPPGGRARNLRGYDRPIRCRNPGRRSTASSRSNRRVLDLTVRTVRGPHAVLPRPARNPRPDGLILRPGPLVNPPNRPHPPATPHQIEAHPLEYPNRPTPPASRRPARPPKYRTRAPVQPAHPLSRRRAEAGGTARRRVSRRSGWKSG